MRKISLLAAAAALSMAAAPAFSAPAANPAAKLSLTDNGDQGGGATQHAHKTRTVLIASAAVIAVVATAVALSHHDSKAASS